MNRTSRWAGIIGVVCGLELVAAIAIGGAGLAALFGTEAAIVVGLLSGVGLWTRRTRRRAPPGTRSPE